MSKAITGELEVDGETITSTFRRTYQMPKSRDWNSIIEANYQGHYIGIDDHGGGLESAKILLQMNIMNIMLKKGIKKP